MKFLKETLKTILITAGIMAGVLCAGAIVFWAWGYALTMSNELSAVASNIS